MKTIIYTPFLNNLNVLSIYAVLTMVLLTFFAAPSFSQVAAADKSVAGIVLFSEDSEPAPGVNIYVKGSTAQGTYTDAEGRFNFPNKVKTGDVLLFSFIGRKTFEYIVTEQITGEIKIVMEPEMIQMIEAVLEEGDEPARPSFFARLLHKK